MSEYASNGSERVSGYASNFPANYSFTRLLPFPVRYSHTRLLAHPLTAVQAGFSIRKGNCANIIRTVPRKTFDLVAWLEKSAERVVAAAEGKLRLEDVEPVLKCFVASVRGDEETSPSHGLPASEDVATTVKNILAARDAVISILKDQSMADARSMRGHVTAISSIAERTILDFVDRAERSWERERHKLKQFREMDQYRRLLMSDTDPLTGVFNQRYFQERLETEVERAIRYGESVSLLICDVDHYLQIQREHSRRAAEEALRMVAATLTRLTRNVDCVSRTQEDEFAVILPEVGGDGAYIAAEKVRSGVEELSFPPGHPLRGCLITVSVGIAACPRNASTHETLLDAARSHLQQAKAGGRNQVFAGE